jgi:hypothetical protein
MTTTRKQHAIADTITICTGRLYEKVVISLNRILRPRKIRIKGLRIYNLKGKTVDFVIE